MSDSRAYIVAEVGNTHEGSLGLAKQFIKVASECGVDAVKFQTHLFEYESLESAPNPPYFKDETRKQYFTRTAFNKIQYKELRRYAIEDCGIDFFSSPFSLEAVDLLEEVGVKQYKIPSGEVSNLPLLKKIAQTGKRVIVSSGMSSWTELDEAVDVLRTGGVDDIIVLQCTTEYPCPPERAGLNIMLEMMRRYPFAQIGFSDHTLGSAVPIAAVTLGAKFVEKHFTLSKNMYGSDAKHSMEPDQFKIMVEGIRSAEKALKSVINKDKAASTLYDMKVIFEKSIVAAHSLARGHIIRESDLAFKKPGNGIPARTYEKLIGRPLARNVEKDHMFSTDDFATEAGGN